MVNCFFITCAFLQLILPLSNPEIQDSYVFPDEANLRFHSGGHMCAGIVAYTPPSESTGDYIACAVSTGSSVEFFTVSSDQQGNYSLVNRNIIQQPSPFGDHYYAMSISFMDLPLYSPNEMVSCIVIPLLHRPPQGVIEAGKIAVYDLERNCLHANLLEGIHGRDVTHVAEYINTSNQREYTVTINGDIHLFQFSSPSPIPYEPKFQHLNRTYLMDNETRTFAASSFQVRSRAYESYQVDYPSSRYMFTTCHLGGVFLFDPNQITSAGGGKIAWLRLPQIGFAPGQPNTNPPGYYHENTLLADLYLGDLHRIAVLSSNTSATGQPALLFGANSGMGLLVYDISVPEDPLLVWQWDNDTRFCHSAELSGDFSWHGAGSGTMAPGYGGSGTSVVPGQIFGVGLYYNPASKAIAVFLGNGADGLRTLDLSYFFNPFDGHPPNNEDRILRRYSESVTSIVGPYNKTMLAWEVRTTPSTIARTNQDILIFTTWNDRVPHDGNYKGTLILSLHSFSESPVTPSTSRSAQHASSSLSLGFPSMNPARGSVSMQITGSGVARLTVYDVAGRSVHREDLIIPPGGTEYTWDLTTERGTNAPNGVYFFHLTNSTGQAITNRFTILRP